MKRLVRADNMFCVPEQLVDSDIVAREMERVTWWVSIVTRTFVGGATESETGGGAVWALVFDGDRRVLWIDIYFM